MQCNHCGSSRLIDDPYSDTDAGANVYRCLDCGNRIVDLTPAVVNGVVAGIVAPFIVFAPFAVFLLIL